MADRSFEIVSYLAETAGQDHDAILSGIISRWPDATGAEIEEALSAYALQQLAASDGALNDNAHDTTD